MAKIDPDEVTGENTSDHKFLDLLPEKPKNTPFLLKKKFYIPFGFAILYGFLMRLSYSPELLAGLGTMTYGFLFFVPVAIGAITVYFAGQTFRIGWFRAIIMPWLPGLIFLLGVSLVNLEVSICLIMASPLFFGASSIGGLVMNGVLRVAQRSPRSRNSAPALLIAMMVVPYLVSGAENTAPPPDQYHMVDTQIIINADVQTVW
ncbi:MAG TPA: hypothetical protein VHL11_11880, partial [Phototrophicaceae bacterium]|nr:hypothetical protein [Phototrophicaceae bacterium]